MYEWRSECFENGVLNEDLCLWNVWLQTTRRVPCIGAGEARVPQSPRCGGTGGPPSLGFLLMLLHLLLKLGMGRIQHFRIRPDPDPDPILYRIHNIKLKTKLLLKQIFDDDILKKYFQIALIFFHLMINQFNYKIIRNLIFIYYFITIDLILYLYKYRNGSGKIALDPVRIRIQFLPRIRPDPDPDPDPAPSLIKTSNKITKIKADFDFKRLKLLKIF